MEDHSNGNTPHIGNAPNGNTHNGSIQIPRLHELAEFRFQLRQFLSFSETASERHGIQAQQYQLLQVIAATPPGQAATISYLAERMVLRHNSTVELVDRAERAGHVRRHSDERDLRRSIIKLTPQGEEVLRHLVPEHLDELDRLGEHLVQALRAVNPPASVATSPAAPKPQDSAGRPATL